MSFIKLKVWVFGSMCIALLWSSCRYDSGVKTLYLAHSLPRNHAVHKGILRFQYALDSISDSKLKLKIFPDGQLGSEREVLELLQIGSIAITKVSAAAMSNFAPEYKVLGIPYLFRDKEHLFDVLEGELGESLLERSSAYLLRGLCYYDAGSRSFYSRKKPIYKPDDLRGMKIRVMNHQMSIAMVNELGGSATPMAYGELYTALQQGVVDGAENNPPSFVSSRHFEVCKYYTLDKHSLIPDVLVMSTIYWDKLSEQEKTWVKSAAQISAQAQKMYWKESVDECFEILKENNVTVIEPDLEPFRSGVQPIIEDAKNDPLMKPLIEEILRY